MIFQSLIMRLGFDTTGWTKGKQTAVRDLSDLKGKSEGFFSDMKSSFGKSSALGQSMKMMAGGGAIGALTAAGRELKDFTGGIVDLKNAYQSGTISAGELTEKTLASLPVLGQFWQAGRNIREIMTGEEAEATKLAAAITAVAKAKNQALKADENWRKETKGVIEDLQKEQNTIADDTALNDIADDRERALAELGQTTEKSLAELHEKITKAIHQDQIDSLSADMDRLTAAPASAQNHALFQRDLEMYKQLTADKKKLLEQQTNLEAEINDNAASKLSKMNRDWQEKDGKDQAESDKKAEHNRTEALKKGIQDRRFILEGRKDELEQAMGKQEKDYRLATTQSMRFAGTVQATLKSDDVPSKQLTELKGIKAELKTLNTQQHDLEESVAVAF